MKDFIVISLIIFIVYIVFKNKNTRKTSSSNYKDKGNINKYKPSKSIEYIDFGKYKGKKFSELPTGYLEWLINNHSSNEIKNKSKDELLKRKSFYQNSKNIVFGIKNYKNGFQTISDLGFSLSRGQNLQVSNIGESIYSKKHYNTLRHVGLT